MSREDSLMEGTNRHLSALPMPRETILPSRAANREPVPFSPESNSVTSRRSEPRFETDEATTVTVIDASRKCITSARILDVSRSGASFSCAESIPEFSRIQIGLGDSVLHGTVLHCTKAPESYRIGVRIDDVCPKLLKNGDLRPTGSRS